MTRALRAAAIIAVVAIYALRLDRVAGLVVDDAWYILLAKAIAQGDGFRLISSAVTPIMPVVPPGFPILLAPVFLLSPQFPGNVLLLKAVPIAAMFGAGAVFYRYLVNQRGTPPAHAAVVALATMLTPAFVFLATSTVMAECVFMLGQVVTIVLLERSGRGGAAGSQLRLASLAGVLAAATMLTRTAGVAVLAAGAIYLLKERAWRRAAALSGAALICLLPWFAYSITHAPTAAESAEHGGSMAYSYSELLVMRRPGEPAVGRSSAGDLPARVARNIVNVLGRDVGGVIVPALLRGPVESGQEVVALGGGGSSMGSARAAMAVSCVLAAVALLGFLTQARGRVSSAEILVVVTVGMVLLVPGVTFRYVLPLAPFLWLYFTHGLQDLAGAVGRRLQSSADAGAAMVRIALLLLIALQLQEHVQYILLETRATPGPDWLEDAREVDTLLSWMNTNLVDEGAVATTNPGLIFLRTGRKTVAYDDPARNRERWRSSGVKYLVSLRTVATPSRSLAVSKLYDSPRRRLFVIELADP